MTENFFTSDHHFFHNNIIKHCNRPYKGIEEMHEAFITNWNSVVGKLDVVYHLGDLALSSNFKAVAEVINRLNGKIRLVLGNHDKNPKKLFDHCKNIEWVRDYQEETFFINGNKHFIVMMHYPLFRWNKSHYGSIHLHGHSHGGINEENKGTRRYDVGVDVNNFTPVNIYDLVEKIETSIDPCFDQSENE